jgi:hypothetical protein
MEWQKKSSARGKILFSKVVSFFTVFVENSSKILLKYTKFEEQSRKN